MSIDLGATTISTVKVGSTTASAVYLGATKVWPTSTIKTGLAAYWSMDEGSGTTYADATGNGHTATLAGTTGWSSPGKVGAYCANYPGATGAGSTFTGISLGTSWSYAGWVKSAASGGYAGYQNLCTQGNARGIWVRGTGSAVDFYDGNDNTASASIGTGVWRHVAVTYDGTTIRHYLDGATNGTNAASGLAAFTPNNMGCDSTGREYFAGQHDEVGLWTRPISSTEVAYLYNGGTGRAYASL